MVFLFVALLVGVLVGPIDLGLRNVLESIGARLHVPGVSSSLSPTDNAILWDLRMPRVVLAALVGGMLALSGATYQGVFRNPLADPYLLGVAAGAGLGATLAIAYLPEGLRGQQALPVNEAGLRHPPLLDPRPPCPYRRQQIGRPLGRVRLQDAVV